MKIAPAKSTPEEQQKESSRFRWLAIAIFLLALSVRLAYFFSARVDYPIRGDIIQYVNYAWNMLNHGTFSSVTPGSAQVPPDAFRGPGYPAFLALWMWLTGIGRNWYIVAVMAQLLVGALLAPLSIAWARLWLPGRASLSVGFLVALWPHAIVFSSTLLSETVFCAALLMFLYLAGHAERLRSSNYGALAGLVGGMAYLINPVAVLFPPMVAAIIFVRKQRRVAVAMIAMFLLLVGGWAARNSMHSGMQGAWDRAAVNIVEGSWPLYHAAYNAQGKNEIASQMMAEISREERVMVQSPLEGIRAMYDKLSYDPSSYARWYLIEKPYALWGWSTGIGWGDVYFLQTSNSPFDRQLVFQLIHESYRYANPLFFVLAVLAAIYAVVRYRRDDSSNAFSLLLAAGFFFYVTIIHTLLQADPRYAVAYRPMQIALAVTACLTIWRYLAWRWHQTRP